MTNPNPYPGQLYLVRNASCNDETCGLFSQRGNGILVNSPYWTYQALMDFLSHPCLVCGSAVHVDTEPATYAEAAGKGIATSHRVPLTIDKYSVYHLEFS